MTAVVTSDSIRQRTPGSGGGLPQPTACDFVAIDFETANETRGSACAVGVTLMSGDHVLASGSTLINPETYFNPYCTAVNGISERDVAGAPTIRELWPALSELLDGALVVAHNASFDMSVLQHSAARYEVTDGPSFEVLCTYRMARVVWPGLPSYSLGYVAPWRGITFHHHEAGDDSRACALLAVAICDELGVPGLHAAIDSHRFLPSRITPESYQSHHALEQHGRRNAVENVDADTHTTHCSASRSASLARLTR